MIKRVALFVAVVAYAAALTSCATTARLMGKGDIVTAMDNMDRIRNDMGPLQRSKHIRQKQEAALERGKQLFDDATLGATPKTCNTCHPNGATTGGEAKIPGGDDAVPIPTLVGAAATFPKVTRSSRDVVTLQQMSNACIEMFLRGRGLALDSEDAVALATYITSLSDGEPVWGDTTSAGRTDLAIGSRLFRDPRLGSDGQSCDSCHAGGGTSGGEAHIPKKMGHGPYKLPIPPLNGAAARFPKYKVGRDDVVTLEMMNNYCIRMFMAGKRLPLDSPEAVHLAQYVTSLSQGSPVAVGK